MIFVRIGQIVWTKNQDRMWFAELLLNLHESSLMMKTLGYKDENVGKFALWFTNYNYNYNYN